MAMPIPQTDSVVSYAYTLKVGGKLIGNLQGFNPSANRTLERVRELQNESENIKEIVPGRTDFQITIDRIEMYKNNIVGALNNGAETPAEQQVNLFGNVSAFEIVETIMNSSRSVVRTLTYTGCRIQNWSKTVREGSVTVLENCTVFPKDIVLST